MKALKSIIGFGVASVMLMPIVAESGGFFSGDGNRKYDGPTDTDDDKLRDALVDATVRDQTIRAFTYIFGPSGAGRVGFAYSYLDSDGDGVIDDYTDTAFANATITDNLYMAYCHDAESRVPATEPESLDNELGRSIEACVAGDSTTQVSAPWHKDWRVFSSDLNVVYYNPQTGYTPWGAVCDTADAECTNADFTGVRSNPWDGSTGYELADVKPASSTVTGAKDLGQMYRQAVDAIYDQYDEFRYEVWVDDKGYTNCADGVTSGCDTGPKMGAGNINYVACSTNLTSCNGEIDLWDSHYTVSIPSSGNATITKTVYADPSLNAFAALTVDQILTTTTTLSGADCFTQLVDPTGGGGTITLTDWATKVDNTVSCMTLAQARQNIADWYQYNRRRAFVVKWAVAGLINSFRKDGLRTGDIAQDKSFAMGMNAINADPTISTPADLFIEVPDSLADDATLKAAQDSLIKQYYAYEPDAVAAAAFGGLDGTPLPEALKRAGDYLDGTLTGITGPLAVNESECQRNFTVLLTDGYWKSLTSPGLGDVDGDTVSDTLADVAKYYYELDLGDDAIADLVTPAGGSPTNDKQTQHMVTATVAFGVSGNLVDTDGTGFPDNAGVDLTESGNWGNPVTCSDCPEKIDDMWHAAYNGRGKFVSASTPEEVAKALQNILPTENFSGSGAATTVANSSTLTTDTALFLSGYFSAGWVGEIKAKAINSDGTVGSDLWSTDDRFVAPTTYPEVTLTDDDGRKIMTFKPSEHKGIALRWPSDPDTPGVFDLDLDQVTLLKAGGSNDDGKERLFYLRGKTAQEARNSPSAPILRSRVNDSAVPILLGDVINSTPFFIGEPPFLYPAAANWPAGSDENDDGNAQEYGAFKQLHAGRTPMVAVGANDGMLHIFNGSIGSDGGTEIMAYMPGTLMERTSSTVPDGIAQYTDIGYDHRFFVNGAITVVDAFGEFPGCGTGKCWRTILVSGLGGGVQGVFALDITNPDTGQAATTEAGEASATALWEFTDFDDPLTPAKVEGSTELGLVMGQPSIVRLADGRWAAVFGNGYNNTTDEDNDGDGTGDCSQAIGGTCTGSSIGSAVLFIVDLATGELIKAIDTGVDYTDDPAYSSPDWRPNGLSEIAAVDVQGDVITDYIYAGDLFGNLWKFDLTSSDPNDWGVAYNGSNCSSCTPLFKAYSRGGLYTQAITAAPEVGKHPEGGYLVYFGTGKYFEEDVDSNVFLANAPSESQTFYAIWDKNSDGANEITNNIPYTRQHLLKQSFASTTTISAGDLAGSKALIMEVDGGSGEPFTPDWHDVADGSKPSGTDLNGASQDHLGWMIDIYVNSEATNLGERVVFSPRIFGSKIAFTTLIPPNSACSSGTDGAVVLLGSITGAAPSGSEKPLLDTNGDDAMGSGDLEDVAGVNIEASSAPSMPKRITQEVSTGRFESTYFFTDDAGNVYKLSPGQEDKDKGRYGWKQLW